MKGIDNETAGPIKDYSSPVLLFGRADLLELSKSNVQGATCILLCPDSGIEPEEATAKCGLPAQSLSDVNNGDLDAVSLSRIISPTIYECVKGAKNLHPYHSFCANDLYSYHFKPQFYMLKLFELLIIKHRPRKVQILFPATAGYWSPERPGLGVFFEPARLSAWLASRYFAENNVPVIYTKSNSLLLWLKKRTRSATIAFAKNTIMFRRVMEAKRNGLATRLLPTKCDALFVHRVSSEVQTLHPVVECCLSHSIKVIHLQDDVTHSLTTAEALKAKGYEYVPKGAFIGPVGFIGMWIRALFVKKPQLAVPDPNMLSDGCLRLLFKAEVLKELSGRLSDSFLQQWLLAVEITELIRRTGANVLVTSAMVDNFGPTMAHAAHWSGARTVSIQNALNNPERYPFMGWADMYCVQSSLQKKRLIESGFPANRLAATGLHHLYVQTESSDTVRPARSEKRILVATQPVYHAQNIQLIDAAFEVAKELNARLIVKLHPRENVSLYQDLAEKLRAFGHEVLTNGDMKAIAADCDVMMSRVSTSILTAIGVGTPVIAFVPSEFRYWQIDYLVHPVTVSCQSVHEAAERLRVTLQDLPAFLETYRANRENYLSKFLSTEFDLPPAEAITSIIASCAGLSCNLRSTRSSP